MTNVSLSPESVAAYKEIMENPAANGMDFPPLSECFEPLEEGTAKHILFQQYISKIKVPLPKIFFYIIMDELYPIVKAADGNLGYKLQIKP